MGRMLLPEGLSGRCFPFSFFQLTGICQVPSLLARAGGGGRFSGTVDACGVLGFLLGDLSPLQPLLLGKMAAGSKRLGEQQGLV